MSRLTPLESLTLSPEQQVVADAIRNGPRKSLRGPFAAWLRAPGFAAHAQEAGIYIRFGSSLPGDLRELVILLTGKYWKAQFEFWAHSRIGRQEGLPQEVIDAITRDERPALDRADLEVAYDFVTEYLATHRISDATYARALDQFGEAGITDIVATSGYYSLVSMTLNVFEVELPEGVEPPLK
jgi:4-carboxymuconolactone decarboxylase